MKPREYFSVAVRVVGLWVLLHLGLWNILSMIVTRAGDFPEYHRGDTAMSFALGVVFSFVGVMLIRNPNVVVDFAFGEEPVTDSSSETNQEPPDSKRGA